MRIYPAVLLGALLTGCAAAPPTDTLRPQAAAAPVTPGELQVEIHSPAADLLATGGVVFADVEGVASTIGGVRYIDMMLVLDTSTSLRRTDPNDYRTAAAVGLIENLSPKSDTQIGVVGFDGASDLTQPLTRNRADVVRALRSMKRSGGTDIAAGIVTALEELARNGRPGSSRVIMLFTDGMSNQRKARDATREAVAQGVAIQTLLLGDNLKGASILDEIAAGTGGTFVWVTDPSKLPEAFLSLRTTGVESVTLSVNGSPPVPARLAGGTFAGSVPLAPGANRIVATATSLDGQTRESMVTVNVQDASCAALEVTAMNRGRPALSLNDRAVEIVVDASRSMWGQINGKAKMAIAKEILQDATHWLPDDLHVALRAYGSGSPSEEKNCADSTLLVPFGERGRDSLRAAINRLRPLGQTPIAYALQQAAADFTALDSERTMVLVTDGIESCGGDPVAAARALRERGITIHLIGFGLGNTPDEDTASLQAIADASGGQYVTANSADELKRALESTVGTRFRVLRDDTVVARGALGTNEPLLLPMGEYRVELDSVPPHAVDVSLAPSAEVTLTLEKSGGVVSHSERRTPLEPTACEEAVATDQPAPAPAEPALTSTLRSWR